MSNLTPFSNINATIIKNVNDNYIKINASLINETLNVISPCYSGPAFVPKDLVSSTGINVINNLDNSLGNARQNIMGHAYDQFSHYTPNYGHKTIELWNQSGGINSVHTRILGIGNGEIDETTGLFKYSGFHVNNPISKGTLKHTTSEYNRFANEGGDLGTTNFLCNRFENAYIDLKFFGQNIFDEFGFNSSNPNVRKNILFINNCFFTSEGLSPLIISGFNEDSLTQQTDINSIGNFNFNRNLEISKFISSINNNYKSIYLKGHKKNNQIKIKHINEKSIIENTNLQNNFNFDILREKGFVSWFFNEDLRQLNNLESYSDFLFVFNRNDQQDDQIDYCSFEDKYQTAKTPWITSQPVDRTDLTTTSRQDIHKKVDNLFRFHSLDDGEVGNRFRIKINPTSRGSYSNDDSSIEYAKFDIYIMQYDPRDNSYELLESHTGLCLDKDDDCYICKKIGTKYKYYDFSANKVVEQGLYDNKSKYLRVEVTDDIENGVNKYKLCKYIPSGFRAYHHIYFDKNSFKNYNNHINVYNIIQTPLEYIYYKNYNANIYNNSITNHWGVQFRRSKKDTRDYLGVNRKILVDKYTESVSEKKSIIDNNKPNIFSPHYFYTRFFSVNRKDNKNIWRQDDEFCNSYFNLEKLCYKDNIDDAIYLRSGIINNAKNDDLYSDGVTEYKFIDLDSDAIYNNNSFNQYFSNKLSFDLFTYGGFDGTNYLDSDKRYLNNNALIREMNGEYENSFKDGPTYNAYKKAIDIATNYENCNCDILVIPGMNDISLHDKCINIAEEQRRFIYIADISGYSNSNNIINDYNESFTDAVNLNILPYYVQISNKGLMNNNFNILKFDNIGDSSYTIDKIEFIDNADTEFNKFKKDITNNIEDFGNIYNNLIKDQINQLQNQFSSRYFMPVFGPLQYLYNDNNNNLKLYLPCESIIPRLFISNPYNTGITNFNISIDGISLIQDINSSLSENLDNIVKEFLRVNGINYFNKDVNNLQLISEHSSYSIRDSIFREIVYVRMINLIKKLVKFDIFINSTVIEGGLLFNNNSKSKNVYQRFEIQMRSLFDRMVNIGLLNSYILKLPKNFDDINVKRDMENYIIRGSVIIKLTNGGVNNIINLQLDELLSDLSLFTETSNYNDTGVYIPNNIF